MVRTVLEVLSSRLYSDCTRLAAAAEAVTAAAAPSIQGTLPVHSTPPHQTAARNIDSKVSYELKRIQNKYVLYFVEILAGMLKLLLRVGWIEAVGSSLHTDRQGGRGRWRTPQMQVNICKQSKTLIK